MGNEAEPREHLEDESDGCRFGCLLIVVGCLALDALAAWAAWQMAGFFGMLLSMLARA